jgi:recombination protein RecT
MTRDELDAVKNRSRASSSGPWQTDFDQMCRKTVIRRNLKYCPKSAQLVKALEAENVIEQDLRQETILDINLPDELKEPETTQAADIINNGILKEKENV